MGYEPAAYPPHLPQPSCDRPTSTFHPARGSLAIFGRPKTTAHPAKPALFAPRSPSSGRLPTKATDGALLCVKQRDFADLNLSSVLGKGWVVLLYAAVHL